MSAAIGHEAVRSSAKAGIAVVVPRSGHSCAFLDISWPSGDHAGPHLLWPKKQPRFL